MPSVRSAYESLFLLFTCKRRCATFNSYSLTWFAKTSLRATRSLNYRLYVEQIYCKSTIVQTIGQVQISIRVYFEAYTNRTIFGGDPVHFDALRCANCNLKTRRKKNQSDVLQRSASTQPTITLPTLYLPPSLSPLPLASIPRRNSFH